MLILLGWFTESGRLHDARAGGLHDRLRRFVDARAPRAWRSELVEGPGWGMFAAAAKPGGWTWDLLTREGDLFMATVGLPVGLDRAVLDGGPAALGRDVLKGVASLEGVVPPFGVVATDGSRFTVEQDWLGMASLYVYRAHGVVAVSNRPVLLPYALGDRVRPDPVGWARYIACDSFAGSVSPVAGVEPLASGQILIGERNPSGHWRITQRRKTTLDQVAAAGTALGTETDLEALVLSAFSRVTTSLARLWPKPLRCGLSGGRDSRLLAANLIVNGLRAEFYTNTDNPAEGDTAGRLMALAREARGVDFDHRLVPRRVGGGDGATGVAQRLRKLFLDFDFSCRRQFVLRGGGSQPVAIPAATINGGIGDIAWGIWVPGGWEQPSGNPTSDAMQALRRGLASKAGGRLVESAQSLVDGYLEGLVERATALGLDQVQSLAWMYCAGRARTWATSRLNFQQTMLYATPEFITAVVALPLMEQKSSGFHRRLTEQLMPEWRGVGYVHGIGVPPTEEPHVWDGDGMRVLSELSECTTGELTWMLDPAEVDGAFATLRSGDLDAKRVSGVNRLLTTFAVLASAEREFDRLNAELTQALPRD